jgi:hypothetical protein
MKARTAETAPNQIAARHSFKTAVVSLALLFAGCGGGGGSTPAAVNVAPVAPAAQTESAQNSFSVTRDDYGMAKGNFLTSSKSTESIVLRSALATSDNDGNFRTVARIDIPAGTVSSAGSYSLGAPSAGNPAFPGVVLFFNGHQSSRLNTVGGTITFTSFGANAGDRITGSYSALVEDGGDVSTPTVRYTVAAIFDFKLDTSCPVLPAPAAASLASGSYDTYCASCHTLASYDTATGGAPDLASKGGKMNAIFSADQPSHKGLRLTAGEITGLKVLLNSK